MSSTISMIKPNGSMRATMDASGCGSRPTRTLPPSNGGSGNMLNTAKEILIKTPLCAIRTTAAKKSTQLDSETVLRDRHAP